MKEEREKEKNLHVQLQAAFDGNVQASGQLLRPLSFVLRVPCFKLTQLLNSIGFSLSDAYRGNSLAGQETLAVSEVALTDSEKLLTNKQTTTTTKWLERLSCDETSSASQQ